ncbi:MAG: hypothetical protein QOG75_2033 [Mycobacterium sp.]|jgi:membrane-associated phospholipid phosphatase|nr:hypothetical protein [Mycobacterium sp.]
MTASLLLDVFNVLLSTHDQTASEVIGLRVEPLRTDSLGRSVMQRHARALGFGRLLFARSRGSAAGNVNRGFPSAHAVSAMMYYPVQLGLLGYWELARTGGVGSRGVGR